MTVYPNAVIMVTMKRFILMFAAIMFLANAFAVSAWAKPCVNINSTQISAEMTDMSDMPCHEGGDEQKSPVQHCDGLCLCLHASINQTPVLNDGFAFNAIMLHSERLSIENERVASMSSAPPRRPPKLNS